MYLMSCRFARERYPYLLPNVAIERAILIRITDMRSVRMRRGFLYLVAILDRYSRYVQRWEVSNTLDGAFYLLALAQVFVQAQSEIFNTN
jgi:putative transposase